MSTSARRGSSPCAEPFEKIRSGGKIWSRARACMMRAEPNIEPRAVERQAVAMPSTTKYWLTRGVLHHVTPGRTAARVEVELQGAAVERPRLPEDEQHVAQEGGGHRADRAERDRAPRGRRGRPRGWRPPSSRPPPGRRRRRRAAGRTACRASSAARGRTGPSPPERTPTSRRGRTARCRRSRRRGGTTRRRAGGRRRALGRPRPRPVRRGDVDEVDAACPSASHEPASGVKASDERLAATTCEEPESHTEPIATMSATTSPAKMK